MAKLVVSTLTQTGNETTFLSALNANFDAVVAAVENTLSRDGTAPNNMEANLDMDSENVINVGAITQSASVPFFLSMEISNVNGITPPSGYLSVPVAATLGTATISLISDPDMDATFAINFTDENATSTQFNVPPNVTQPYNYPFDMSGLGLVFAQADRLKVDIDGSTNDTSGGVVITFSFVPV